MSGNCSRSISHGNMIKWNMNRFDDNISIKNTVTLKSVNVGSGTTGTRGVNGVICEKFGIKAIHYTLECNVHYSEGVVQQWTVAIIVCTNNESLNCKSNDLLEKYPVVLNSLLTSYDFASDFPVGEILPDLMRFAPNISVIATLRDPVQWTTRRFEEHANTAICHPSLWNDLDVFHPFDIVACLRKREMVKDALIPIAKFRLQKNGFEAIRDAFIAYNSYYATLMSQLNHPYLPICLWNHDTSAEDDLTQILSVHWAQQESTRGFTLRPVNSFGSKPREVKGYNKPALRKLARVTYGKPLSARTAPISTVTFNSVTNDVIPGSHVTNTRHLQLAENSNCSDAIASFPVRSGGANIVLGYSKPRFGLTIPGLNQADITLKSINIGSGTTGTRTLNSVICTDLNVNSIHWYAVCNNRTADLTIQEWSSRLYKCTYLKSLRCKTGDLLERYPKMLFTLLTQVEYASDFPLGELLPDILAFVPDISVLMTLRNPAEWAVRRKATHRNTPICARHLWNHANVLHPFDMIGCLHSVKFVHDGLVPVESVSVDMLANAFRRYNTVSSSIVTSNHLSFLPMCLWDVASSTNEDIGRLVRGFWRERDSTSVLGLRSGRGQEPVDPWPFAKKGKEAIKASGHSHSNGRSGGGSSNVSTSRRRLGMGGVAIDIPATANILAGGFDFKVASVGTAEIALDVSFFTEWVAMLSVCTILLFIIIKRLLSNLKK